MKDPNNELRAAYWDALQDSITLNAVTVDVYDFIKASANPPYIYFADFEAVEESCKDGHGFNVTMGLSVITKYTDAKGGSKDSDDITNQILTLLHSSTYLGTSNFRVITNRLASTFTTKRATSPTGVIITRTIRLEHYVDQIGGNLTRITDLAAVGSSTTTLDLAWSNVTGNTGYRIERSTDLITWSLLTTVLTDVVTYEDTGLTTNTIYHYRVRAFDASGGSAWSNTASVTTGQTATVENSNESYSETVVEGSTLVLPDIDHVDTDGSTVSTPAQEVFVAIQQSGIAYQRPPVSGLTTSYRTGDDAWHLVNGSYDYTPPTNPTHIAQLDTTHANPHFNLVNNNAFGNKNRFTDINGLQVYGDSYIIDHLTGLGIYNALTSGTWNTNIDNIVSDTSLGYTDWRMINVKEVMSIYNSAFSSVLNYAPFSFGTTIETSSTRIGNTAQIHMLSQNAGVITPTAKTSTLSTLRIRNHYT